MTSARRFARRAARPNRALSSSKRDFLRRGLSAERLETRALLAGDLFVSDYWNAERPQDVNADGSISPIDALMVINQLNAQGTRAVTGVTLQPGAIAENTPEGETGGTSGELDGYTDVNNDGYISPIDALMVINALNGEGEPARLQYRIYPVAIGTQVTETGTPPTVLTTIPKGQDYELVVTVKDLRSGTQLGPAAGFLDIFYQTSLTTTYVNEIQDIVINNNTGGSFTLTFGGQTTASIPWDPFNPETLFDDIDLALENLSTIGAGDIEVIHLSGSTYRAKFTNGLGDQNVGDITGTMVTGGGTVSITTIAQGTISDPVAFREAWRSEFGYPNANNRAFFQGQFNAGNFPDRVDDLGGTYLNTIPPSQGGIYPGTFERELARVRMNANEGGIVTFTPSLASIEDPAHDSLLYADPLNPNQRSEVAANEIDLGPVVTLTITEPVEANPDIINRLEDSAQITFNPINGTSTADVTIGTDVKNAGANPAPLRITSINGISTPNTDIVLASGSIVRFSASTTSPSISYTPGPNLNGLPAETFSYTISDTVNVDSAIVTVNLTAQNDAPVNRINGAAITGATAARSATEDIDFLFNAANSSVLSVFDVDGSAATIQVTLELPVGAGVLDAVDTAGVVIQNDNTNSVTLTGSLTNINAALNGLRYDPALNFSGSTTLTITTNDQGNGSSPPGTSPLTDIDVVTINVAAVNDAPVNSVPPGLQTVDENIPGNEDQLVFSAGNGNAINVSDVDAGSATIDVNVSVLHGNLTATPTAGVTITGNGTASVTLSGSQANINASLNSGLTYVPTLGYTGGETLTVTTDDNGNTGTGGTLTDIDTITIEVEAVLRPRARPDTVNRTEGQGAIDIDVMDNDLPHIPVANFQTTLLSFTQPFGLGDRGTVSRNDNGTNNGTPGDISDDSPADLADDTLIYTPPADVNFFGTVTFEYTINDTFEPGVDGPVGTPDANSTTTVTIIIAPVNDQPVAVVDPAFAMDEDTTLSTTIGQSLLNNDTDPDNEVDTDGDGNDNITNTLTAEFVPGSLSPAGGSLTVNANGTFTYTPPLNHNGVTTFQYRVNDNQGQANSLSAPQTVTINIAPINDKPVGSPDPYTVAEDGTLTANGLAGNPAGVLANDNDGDPEVSQPLSAVLVAGSLTPAGGTLNFNSDGTFTYSPPADFNGPVTFQYRADDGQAANNLSDPVTVTINVTAVNDKPVGTPDPYVMNEDGTLVANGAGGNPAGVLANDNDGDPEVTQSLTAQLVAGSLSPAGGSLVFNTNGTFTYTPPANFNSNVGLVTFQYLINDGQAANNLSDPVTVTITVNPVNDVPVANPDSGPTFNTSEDVLLSVAAPGVLANDDDGDPELSQTLVAQLVAGSLSPVGSGVLTFNSDGSFDFDPADNFSGTVTFQYRANDQQAANNLSAATTVTILVGETNDPPTAFDDFYTAIKNFVDQTIDVIGGDAPADSIAPDVGETLTISGLSTDGTAGTFNATATTARGGTVTIAFNAELGRDVVLYDSPTNFESPPFDTFFYQISDGRGGFDVAEVTVEVLAFVPKIIEGIVYHDADGNGQIYNGDAFTDVNGNGVYDGDGRLDSQGNFIGEPFALGVGPNANQYDPPEKRLQGVTVELFGTDFLGVQVGTSANPIQVQTDAQGRYRFIGDASTQFLGLKPGSYTIREVQPGYLLDGHETESSALASRQSDNHFQASWGAQDFSGNITGLNFGEGAWNTNATNGGFTNPAGLIADGYLASSRRNGLVIALDASGDSIWSWSMPGWNNLHRFELILDANQAHATLRVWDTAHANDANPSHIVRIHQETAYNGDPSYPNSPAAGSQARFRVLGSSSAGIVIRIDGTAAEFGLNLLAAAPVVGEGEAEGEAVVDGQYAEAVDAVFGEGEAWA